MASTVCGSVAATNNSKKAKEESTEQNEIGSAVLSDTPNTLLLLKPILLSQYNNILQMTQLKNFWGEPNDRPHKVEGPCLNRTFNAAVSSSSAM